MTRSQSLRAFRSECVFFRSGSNLFYVVCRPAIDEGGTAALIN